MMADCPHAVILSAILLTLGYTLFGTLLQTDGSRSSNAHDFATFTFLTAVFAWISAHDINIFFCKLSSVSLFFYEFFTSFFIMETSLLLFWRPLEHFLTSKLPSLLEKMLLKGPGSCALNGFFCAGHTLVFTVLVHLMALNVLWCVLFGFGVVHGPILKV